MPLTNGARNGAGGHAEATVRTYLHRLLVQRDLSVCEEMLAANYVDHDAPAGTPPGPGPTREYMTQLLHAYPDLRFTIVTVAAQDRSVAVRATWRGTHRETGSAFHQTGLMLIHLDESGRLAERWSAYHHTLDEAAT
jgi:predicted ester cyclase